jgi:hypothetical protein
MGTLRALKAARATNTTTIVTMRSKTIGMVIRGTTAPVVPEKITAHWGEIEGQVVVLVAD